MICACGRMITPEPTFVEKVWNATSYATCVYRCECGRGYSNASTPAARTCITDTPQRNVPTAVTEGLEDVLAAALNVRNRRSKREKFCFSSSEDAVTWTIFSWLDVTAALSIVPTSAGLSDPGGDGDILFWGVPARRGGRRADALHSELIVVSDERCEDPNRRSEPDVVISWPGLLVFVEVKYRARNDFQPGYVNFAHYTDRADLFAVSPSEVAQHGYYELVRNWRLGVGLAERLAVPFALINLGPERLASRTPDLATSFRLNPNRQFASLSWGALLDAASSLDRPTWIDDFIRERQLDSRWS